MSRRSLVLVLGLTVGDSLLWSWSLNANHDVIALASGLTLPPLTLVSLWLLAIGAARLLGRMARRPAERPSGQRRESRGYAEASRGARPGAVSSEDPAGSRKLAA